jgi:hypothetical protein
VGVGSAFKLGATSSFPTYTPIVSAIVVEVIEVEALAAFISKLTIGGDGVDGPVKSSAAYRSQA